MGVAQFSGKALAQTIEGSEFNPWKYSPKYCFNERKRKHYLQGERETKVGKGRNVEDSNRRINSKVW